MSEVTQLEREHIRGLCAFRAIKNAYEAKGISFEATYYDAVMAGYLLGAGVMMADQERFIKEFVADVERPLKSEYSLMKAIDNSLDAGKLVIASEFAGGIGHAFLIKGAYGEYYDVDNFFEDERIGLKGLVRKDVVIGSIQKFIDFGPACSRLLREYIIFSFKINAEKRNTKYKWSFDVKQDLEFIRSLKKIREVEAMKFTVNLRYS